MYRVFHGLVVISILAQAPTAQSSNIQSSASLAKTNATEQIRTLEEAVEQLKKESKKSSQSTERLNRNFLDYTQKLKIHGFMSAGLSQSNRDLVYYGTSNDLTTLARGRMGLQFDFKLNPKTRAVVQVLGKAAEDDWNIATQWAYLSYRPSNPTEFRLGRIRLPVFYYSETIEIGYSFPWVTPPVETYGAVPFHNMDGMDYSYLWVNQNWASKLKLAWGNNSIDE